MFDLETLDIQPTATILSLGITSFKLAEVEPFMDVVNRGLHLVFATENQVKRGCTVSADTQKWWSEQSQAAQDVLLNGTTEINEIPELLNEHFDFSLSHARWYCRGPAFDVAILQHCLDRFGLQTPWLYGNVRDTRTWFDFYPGWEWTNKPSEFVAHNALHDSAMEILQMQKAFRSAQ
jgi:hypothetical protein